MVRLVLSLVFCVFIGASYSQQYSFIPYSIEDGLPQTQVSSIIQDSEGNLWIGTVGGISKFNGLEFFNYSKSDGLLNNQVNCLFLGDNDEIWMGCNGGVSIISGSKVKSHHLSGALANASIRCLVIKDEYLYMGSRSDGLFRCLISDLSDTISNLERIGEYDLRIREFAEFQNELLIGTDHGLKLLQQDSLTSFHPKFDRLNIMGVTVHEKELWLSTTRQGVYKYEQNKVVHFDEENGGLNTTSTRSLIIDKHGNPWVASRFGLERWIEDEFVSYNSKNGLVNDSIKVVFEDREGNIWVGSDGAGILKFSGDRFVALTRKEGIASDLVMSFAEDSAGMWISTYGGGITYYQGNRIKNYTKSEQFSHQLIWCSEVDAQNRIWFGTSNGITIHDKSGLHPHPIDPIIDNVRVTSILEHNGKIFIGHRKGLSYVKNGLVTHFKTDVRLVRAMTVMPNGSLMIGGSNGLYEYKGGQLEKLFIENDTDLYPVFC
ncbi:MAG: hypothetical protein JKY54_15285, partial [Flavobacteriales bacterium]|nr:hypothetical protein [Flavobacteriales bacterium]